MNARQLWDQKFSQLAAKRGALSFQRDRLDKQIAEVDRQLEALDTTAELAAGLDREAAAKPPEAPAEAKP